MRGGCLRVGVEVVDGLEEDGGEEVEPVQAEAEQGPRDGNDEHVAGERRGEELPEGRAHRLRVERPHAAAGSKAGGGAVGGGDASDDGLGLGDAAVEEEEAGALGNEE